MLNYTAVLTNTVHHSLLLEGIKYFLLSTSKPQAPNAAAIQEISMQPFHCEILWW